MRNTLKRCAAILVACSLLFSAAFAENEQKKGFFDSIGDWFDQAADDTVNWAGQAWSDASSWVSQAWDDVSEWTQQAWNDSSKWVSQAWTDSSAWVSTNWDSFIVWANTVLSGDPYSWIRDNILENGLFAYDKYVELRAFLNDEPGIDQIRQRYEEAFSELSLLNEDKETLWDLLVKWSDEKQLKIEQTAKLALPFLTRLLIDGEKAIGEDAVFSGPVVGQYLLTIMDVMDLDSVDAADMRIKVMRATLEGLTRPTIIGDTEQNILITEDQYYIENFTAFDGKYQIVLTAFRKDESSEFPQLRGRSVQETVQNYFQSAEIGDLTEQSGTENDKIIEVLPFSYQQSENRIEGRAVAVWTQENNYVFYVLTDQEWNETEFEEWSKSITFSASNNVAFEADLESDGAFYGINQSAQKYTINRIFDEDKFRVPKTGHGWAAERGNNLIDNLKGFFKGRHSTVVGDNNAANGADRITTFADGSRLLIQTKYHATASKSISACFDENGFRYIDHVEGKPMAIEVPADQYETALEYMKNHISNGDFKEYGYDVTDTDRAVEIVKKGELTYQQARHIAKAGRIESILYDSYHACITAGTAMGLTAAVDFAINLWNGEPVEAAIKDSLLHGLKSGGITFIISVLSAQVAKTGINTALIPASKVVVHALGPKASALIVNAFRPAGSAIYGAAAMQSAAKLLRGNVITSAVTFVVLSAGDVADIIQGKISWKQLAKNVSTTVVGIAGGSLGWIGGAALGTAIMPGAGTVVGIILSVAAGWGASEGAKAVADLIAEDDADEMIRIIESEFSDIAEEYFLNEEEVNKAVENLQGVLTPDMLKQMYQYKDHSVFARQLIEMAIDPVVAERAYVELPSEEEYSEYLTEVLETICDDLEDESASE